MIRIQQAAEIVGRSPSTIRKLEAAGAVPRAARNRGNQRVYTDPDLAAIRRVVFPDSVIEVQSPGGRDRGAAGATQ